MTTNKKTKNTKQKKTTNKLLKKSKKNTKKHIKQSKTIQTGPGHSQRSEDRRHHQRLLHLRQRVHPAGRHRHRSVGRGEAGGGQRRSGGNALGEKMEMSFYGLFDGFWESFFCFFGGDCLVFFGIFWAWLCFGVWFVCCDFCSVFWGSSFVFWGVMFNCHLPGPHIIWGSFLVIFVGFQLKQINVTSGDMKDQVFNIATE